MHCPKKESTDGLSSRHATYVLHQKGIISRTAASIISNCSFHTIEHDRRDIYCLNAHLVQLLWYRLYFTVSSNKCICYDKINDTNLNAPYSHLGNSFLLSSARDKHI